MNTYYMGEAQVVEAAAAPVAATTASAWKVAVPALIFLGVHAPLAYVMRSIPMVATIHMVLVLAIGLLVVSAPRNTDRVTYVCAYIAGSEILWRMSKATMFWETGKYAIALLLLMALIRSGRGRANPLPLIYLALLIPSAVMTAATHGLSESREDISFNLSGPFALMVCSWFFSRVGFSRKELHWMWIALLGPIVGAGFLAFFGIASAEEVKYTAHSASSAFSAGGYGPNQVSSMLGLGALLALMFVISRSPNRVLRYVMLVVMLWLAGQSAMTMSRGGMYTFSAAAIFAVYFAIRDPRLRARIVVFAVPVYIVIAFIAIPKLDDFTDGALTRRFQDTGTTGRSDIVEGDLELWSQNPVLGVGAGQSPKLRSTHTGWPAHTEYSRMVADHGMFGLVAIFVMLAMAVMATWKARTTEGKAIASACAVWALVFMTHAAMRLVAPSFVFGLGMATLVPDEDERARPALDAPSEGWQL